MTVNNDEKLKSTVTSLPASRDSASDENEAFLRLVSGVRSESEMEGC